MKLRKLTAFLAALLMVVSMMPLSVFAEMGGDFPWTEESNPTLIEQILQRDGFIDGIWFPWFHGGTVGHNLTSNELMADYYDVAGGTESSWREVELDAYGADKIYREIYNLKSMGYNIMAYGGSIMAEGVVFDANGDVIGIKQDYLDNARRLLNMCREIGMPVMWNVYFHCSSMPDYYGIDGWKVMCQMLGNPTVADHYAERFVRPLCEMLAEYPDVVALVSIADEPENEINDIGMGDHYDNIRTLYGVNQDDMVYFMQQINETVREELPDMPRTVASNAGNKSIYRDFNLDLIGHNQYIDNPNFNTIESMISDADMIMTEYNVGNRDTNDESYANKLIAFRQDMMAKGYKGGFQWCWIPKTPLNNDYSLQRIASDPTSFRKTVSLLKYYMDGYRAAYRGETVGLDAPVLYANAGDGKVLWIPSQNATTITIQRSDNGGATWKTLASNIKQANYVDQYLVGRYTDTTTKPASGYCYRIIASDGSQTVTSAPNNLAGTEDKFVNKNYVSPNVTDGIYYQPTYDKTESYAKLTSIGVNKNRPANESLNLIQDGGFETTVGQWNTNSFLQYAQVVEDNTTPNGSKSLFFNTSSVNNAGWYTFTVGGLNKNTEYTFSAFIKGAYLANDNKGFGSIGVIDPDTNRFMVYWDCYKNYARGSRETQQIYPTAWDDEWHLRSVTFNSGNATSVTIALYGYDSKMWVDGLALFESANGVKYNNGESSKALTSTEWEDLSATVENTIEDPYINNASYWNSGAGYKQGFMSVANGALKYTASPDPCAVRYIKWIDVKPNTDYYVSFTVNVTAAGIGRFAVLDNAKLLPYEAIVVDFSSTGSKTYQGRISSGRYDQLGLCVVDLGGCATIDDICFYEAGESQPIVTEPSFDGYVVNGNFEIGSVDGWENLWNNNTVQITAGHNSAYAMSVVSGEWEHMRQFIAVEPNTDYILELWSKEAVDTAVLIKNGGDTVNLKQVSLPGGPDWTKTTLEFNSGSYTQIILSLMGNTDNASYSVDDVIMRKKTAVSNDGFIVNGDFETGTVDGWENLYGYNTIQTVIGRNSQYAIKVLANEYTQVRQKVTVKKNTDYVIELWSKDATNAILIVKDSADNTNIAQQPLLGHADWQKVTMEFNSGNNEFVYVGLMGGVNSAAYTVDDVTMYEKQEAFGLHNGDFEQQEKYWSFHSGSHAIVSDSYDGLYALQLTNPDSWGEAAIQTVAVDPDSYYTITWWYKANYGTKVFNLIAMHSSGNMEVHSGRNYMSDYSGSWQQGSYVVYTGSSTTMMLKFTSETANAGTILIDAVAIEKICPHEYDSACDDTCNLCGEIREVSHNYYSSVTKSPTCVAIGIRTHTCYYCYDSYTEEIPATGAHTYSNECDAYCNVCNGYRSAPHSYSGSCDTTCNLCGATRSAYASHTYSNTCDSYCNVCNHYRTASHSYYETYREEANCGSEGMIWYECLKCGDMYTETIPTTGQHKVVEEITTPPTCITPGEKLIHCSVCNAYGYWEQIPPNGEHTYLYECDTLCRHCGQVTRPDASHTWTDDGCSICHEKLFNGDFELGEAYWLFHVGVHAIVTDDTHSGDKALQLSELKTQWGEAAIQSIQVLPNTIYEISWWYKAAPGTGVFNLFVMEDAEGYRNLTAVGGQAYMNNYSGNWQKMTYRVDTGDATAMLLKFSTETVDPGTILIDDISVKSLYDLCQHEYTIDSMEAPTCTENGVIYKHCDKCDQQWAEIVPALGHTEVIDEAVAPTCTTTGLSEGKHCSACGEVLVVQTVVDTLDHTYTGDYDTACNVCGAIRQVELPIVFSGNSVSEDVSGLAFQYDLPVMGIKANGTTAVYDEATLDGYKLLGMGAVVTNGFDTIEIPCVYLYDWKSDSCNFAVRIIDIPTGQYDAAITATPYVVLEIDGVATTIYGEAQTSTYNNAANG